MILKNGTVCTDDFSLEKLSIKTENSVISQIGENVDGHTGETVIDCTGKLVLPGFIDIHIHGTNGCDVCDKDEGSLQTVSLALAENGITSFCPATMTLSENELSDCLKTINEFRGKEQGAYIHGVNLEGPYISKEKSGSQKKEYIRRPDFDEFERLCRLCPIKLVDVAPEARGAEAFAKKAGMYSAVSVAHTNADYKTASHALKNGFSHATHLFNAMTGLGSRESGCVGAVLENENITAELICDGFHISPPTLKLAFKLLGKNRSVIVSDSMMAANMPDGEYTLGENKVFVKNSKALLADGTIAASTDNIFNEFKKVISYGVPFEQALRSVSINPARVIGEDKTVGSLKKGKTADIVITDKDLNISAVIIRGKIFRTNQKLL